MELTPQQDVAIDSDSPDILLSAGAGSGKTSTTVRRYERLLTGERPEPAFLVTKPFNPDMVKALISQALFFDRQAKAAA